LKAIFSSELYYVRRLKKGDINEFYEMLSSTAVMQYVKPVSNFDENLGELKRFISYYDTSDKFYQIWAVIDMSNNEFIGICGLYLNTQKEYEIAYRLRERYWRKGLGKLIAGDLIQYCKHLLKLPKLVAYVPTSNIRSLSILKSFMKYHSSSFDEINGYSEDKYELHLSTIR
jgi:ribosomal-protein-alanine N-acetyltransferase